MTAILTRRRDARAQEQARCWCDECVHFCAVSYPAAVPADHVPCNLGHAVKFRLPADYGEPYGFYLTRCADRVAA